MATLKAIRKRISSVQNTEKITRAMKMVAAAKLRGAEAAALAARPYTEKLTALLHNVAARVGTTAHPLLQVRPEIRTTDLLLITSDRGLCGAYNTNLIRKAEAFLTERGRDNVRLTIVGRRGYDFFRRRGFTILDKHINLFGGPGATLATALGEQFAREYVEGTCDAVYMIYSQFRSALVQVPTLEALLPIEPPPAGETEAIDYLYEPDPASLLDRLLRQYVTVLIHHAFLESIASGYAAQMTAMESATKNASEMIDRLTLDMHRARQAGITKELMEIVAGAEALRG